MNKPRKGEPVLHSKVSYIRTLVLFNHDDLGAIFKYGKLNTHLAKIIFFFSRVQLRLLCPLHGERLKTKAKKVLRCVHSLLTDY